MASVDPTRGARIGLRIYRGRAHEVGDDEIACACELLDTLR